MCFVLNNNNKMSILLQKWQLHILHFKAQQLINYINSSNSYDSLEVKNTNEMDR